MPVLLTEAVALVTPCPVALTDTLPVLLVDDASLLLELTLEPPIVVAADVSPLVALGCW